ncbi:MAG: polymer-forming cytoskeletal protein, partial [Deltaproteobacteria bacterium]|nr:polymer-forming cytoskeletal protein [Deltaproteobacteria bacterium]
MFGRKKNYQDLDQDDDVLMIEARAAASAEPAPGRHLAESAAQGVRRLQPPLAQEERVTIIGEGVTMEGKLRFKGRARIEGVFQGTVERGDQLEVGPQAVLEADVFVGSLLIQGCVTGNVVAQEGVEIQAGGKMKGNIKTPAFQVHRGALFTGHCE